MRQGASQAFAGQDTEADFGNDAAQSASLDVRGEELKSLVEADPGLEQQRQIQCESGNVFGPCALNKTQSKRRRAGVLMLGRSVNWDKTKIFDSTQCVGAA